MKTLLFGVIFESDIAVIQSVLLQENLHIDGVELRLDLFKEIDFIELGRFLKMCKLPVMFTVRRNDQGGSFLGTEKQRLKLLESLCVLQPAYLDLEYDVPLDFRKRLFENFPDVIFLSSIHDFSCTPKDLEFLFEKIKTPYAHVYKIAVTAHSTLDALRMLLFVKKHSLKDKLIGICMGKEGQITRILAPVVGGFLTYGSLKSTSPNALGQLGVKELLETFNFRSLNRQSEIYGLIGDPVDKSLGHLMHNAVFLKASTNAVYVKMQIRKEELCGFFEFATQLPIHGLSVTMPLKNEVMTFLSMMSDQVKCIGACNTIHLKEGERIGYNTDGIAAINAIEQRMSVNGRHIVFIGAGGAAKAMIFEATKRGALITVINRTKKRAVEVAARFNGKGGGFELLPKVCKEGYDVMIHCTPENDLIDEKWILPKKIAMDIVYIPKNTSFLIKSSQKNCQIVFGYEMFIGQALEQHRIWFSKVIK